MAIKTARLQSGVKSPLNMQVKKSLAFQKRKLNIKPKENSEALTLEAIFKNQSEILSARNNERELLHNKTHQ